MWNSISLNNYKMNHNSSSNQTHQGSSSSESSATGDSQPLGYKASLNECGNFTLKEVCQYIFGRIITGASYTVRHWELAKNAETHQAAFAHRLLGFLEGIPIAGSVVAVVERFFLESRSEMNTQNIEKSETVQGVFFPFPPDGELSNYHVYSLDPSKTIPRHITFENMLKTFGLERNEQAFVSETEKIFIEQGNDDCNYYFREKNEDQSLLFSLCFDETNTPKVFVSSNGITKL